MRNSFVVLIHAIVLHIDIYVYINIYALDRRKDGRETELTSHEHIHFRMAKQNMTRKRGVRRIMTMLILRSNSCHFCSLMIEWNIETFSSLCAATETAIN